MRKKLCSILIVLVMTLGMGILGVNADESISEKEPVRYIDDGYIAYYEAPNGTRYPYISSNHDHVLICNGYYMASPRSAGNVQCYLSPLHIAWMKVFHGEKYRKRLQIYGLLKYNNFEYTVDED